jgi:F0F1-type ATP synthase membrane subunit b/b'
MELLISLGVNQTLAYQFGIFVVVYLTLKYVLFVPYFHAYNERNERTVGKTELAERFVAETHELEQAYAQKAQEVNERYKSVYDRTRAEAVKEYDRLVGDARAQGKKLIDEARNQVQKEMTSARTQLAQEINGISQLINHKLIGKDLST